MSKQNRSNYDKFPVVPVSDTRCAVGWTEIALRLEQRIRPGRFILAVECYPGCFEKEIQSELVAALNPQLVICASNAFLPEERIRALTARDLGDDPVFGFMNNYELEEFFDPNKVTSFQNEIENASGLVVVIGTGATLIPLRWDLLVYADMARWEIQRRQRANELSNLGLDNPTERASLKYKRAFFVDWRAADRLKKGLLHKIDFLLDTNERNSPKLITGTELAKGLNDAARRPFRVVPFFDPGRGADSG